MRKRISVRIRKFFDRFRVRISTGIAVSLLLHILLLTLRLGLPGLGLPGLTLPFSDRQAQTLEIKASIVTSGSQAPAPPPPPIANTAEPKPLEAQSSEKPPTDLPNARVKRAPNKTAQKATRSARALESTPALARAQRKQGSLPQEDQSAPAPASTQQQVVTTKGDHPDTFKVPPPQPDDFVRTVPKVDSTPMPPQPTPTPAAPAIAMQTPKQTIDQAQEPTPAVEKPAEAQSYERPDEAHAKETAPPEETKDVAMAPGEKKDGEEVSEQEKERKQVEQEAAQRAADEETRKLEEQRKAQELAKQEAARKQLEQAAQQAAAAATAKREAEQKKEQEQQEAQRLARETEARKQAEATAAKQEAVKQEAARQEAEEQRKATELAAKKQAEEEQRQKDLAVEQQKQIEQAAREKAAAVERQRQEELAAEKRAQDLAAKQKAEADAAAQRENARIAAAAAASAAARANAPAGNGSVAANSPGNAASGNGNGNGNGQGNGNGKGNGNQPTGNAPGSLTSNVMNQLGKLDLSPRLPPTGESDRPADDTRPRSIFGLYDHDYKVEAYIRSWRTKIENNGDLNYSQRIADMAREDPVVTVTIASDGSVKDVIINKTSGRPEIDEAVLRIVHVRAPYSVFPPELASKYDSIVIRRVWNFGEKLQLLEEVR